MGFVRTLAKGGLFGLTGIAANALLGKHKKKDDPQPKSLVSGDYNKQPDPSLVNKSIY